MKRVFSWRGRDGTMESGRMPPMFGKDWRPSSPLKFYRTLHKDAARDEIITFIAQQHPGFMSAATSSWGHLEKNEPEHFEADSWQEFSHRFLESLQREIMLQISTHNESLMDVEVIPRRDMKTHIERRIDSFLLDARLMLRRLAHYMSVSLQQRMEWQRLMTRTRALDSSLKNIFTDGIETPDGSMFGGKGFRSTWQEGVVAVGTALSRTIDSPRESSPTNGYEGDLVAPMIRDIGLSLAMGDTPLDVMAANLGKVDSNQNGGWDDAGGRDLHIGCLLYTSPSPRDQRGSRMPSSA